MFGSRIREGRWGRGMGVQRGPERASPMRLSLGRLSLGSAAMAWARALVAAWRTISAVWRWNCSRWGAAGLYEGVYDLVRVCTIFDF